MGDIPIIGELFKQTSSSYKKRNLMVFIHPIIIRDDETFASISGGKYNMFRDQELKRNKEGIRLLPIRLSTPVLPALDSTIVIAPDTIQEISTDSSSLSGI